MKNRVFKNWKTSLLGLVLLIIMTALLFTDRMTWDQFWLTFPTVVGFIYVKDTIFKIE